MADIVTAVAIRCGTCNRLLLRADVDLDRAETEGLTFGGEFGPTVAPEPGYIMVPSCRKHSRGRWVWPPRRPGPVAMTVARKVSVLDLRTALRRGDDLTV